MEVNTAQIEISNWMSAILNMTEFTRMLISHLIALPVSPLQEQR